MPRGTSGSKRRATRDWQKIGKQGQFQLEANDDVQVVSHLVGLDPDQAGRHVVDGGQELVERDIMKDVVKHPPGHGEPVLPERPASPHRVFPEPRLRLVDAQGDRLAHRRAKMLRRQPLFVERVADLVENPKECIAELTLVVTGRDPGVPRPDPGAEWVGRHVQPAPLKVETRRCGDRLPKDPLSIERIGALRIASPCAPALPWESWPSRVRLAEASLIACTSGTGSSRKAWNKTANSVERAPGS